MGHHAGQLAVAQGADDGEGAGDEPDDEQEPGRADGAGDVGADDEDARPDHGPMTIIMASKSDISRLKPMDSGALPGRDRGGGSIAHGFLLSLLFRMP